MEKEEWGDIPDKRNPAVGRGTEKPQRVPEVWSGMRCRCWGGRRLACGQRHPYPQPRDSLGLQVALASCHYCSKFLHTQWLKATRTYSLTVLEVRGPK